MAVVTGPPPVGTKIRQRGIPHEAIFARLIHERGINDVVQPRGEDPDHHVIARVNGGRWIADCPDAACTGAEMVSVDDPTFYCWSCYNNFNGNRIIPVTFPSDGMRASIEAVLLQRPHPDFMSWDGATTIAELRNAGPWHRSWTAPRTWTTGEVVTATMLNTHVRDNELETAPAKVTTNGDMLYGTGPNALVRLAVGSTDQMLSVAGGIPSWQPSAKSVLTTAGDMLFASAANTLARVGKPSSATAVLGNDGTNTPTWRGTSGSNGNVLVLSGGVPTWTAAAAASEWAKISSGALSSAANLDLSGLSGYKRYRLQLIASPASAATTGMQIQVNGHTTTYMGMRTRNSNNTLTGQNDSSASSLTAIDGGGGSGLVTDALWALVNVHHDDANSKNVIASWLGGVQSNNGTSPMLTQGQGTCQFADATITELKLIAIGAAWNGYYILEGSNS